jgi:hypothetical protein
VAQTNAVPCMREYSIIFQFGRRQSLSLACCLMSCRRALGYTPGTQYCASNRPRIQPSMCRPHSRNCTRTLGASWNTRLSQHTFLWVLLPGLVSIYKMLFLVA